MQIKVADYSTAPGPRLIQEGKFSGEHFRNTVLAPKLREAAVIGEELVVDLDGTSGYACSFLEEAFGGLIREGKLFEGVAMKILSNEEPDLLDEISRYMIEAAAFKEIVGEWCSN